MKCSTVLLRADTGRLIFLCCRAFHATINNSKYNERRVTRVLLRGEPWDVVTTLPLVLLSLGALFWTESLILHATSRSLMMTIGQDGACGAFCGCFNNHLKSLTFERYNLVFLWLTCDCQHHGHYSQM
jgi:hypothetical protein